MRRGLVFNGLLVLCVAISTTWSAAAPGQDAGCYRVTISMRSMTSHSRMRSSTSRPATTRANTV
jgi:hypothetical protein